MEVALAVGGAFLSSFMSVAFDRSSKTRKFIEFFQGKNVIELDEEILDRLEITLHTISVVLEDAEDKQGKSPAVRRWLNNLKHSVNHADDLLDGLNTECLRLKLDYQFRQKQSGVDLKLSLNPDVIEELMPDLKKVTERLEKFVNQIHLLGLQKLDSKEKYADWAPSSSVVDKSNIFGRDDEKEKLIQTVLSNEGTPDVSVIPITGMGGIGKTTLAQLVYDDDRVKEKFQKRAWVCVSEEYDAERVTKDLLMEVNHAVVDDKDGFNRLQVKLKDNLAGKCFLIILDDIWNDKYNDWSRLKNPLNYGNKGSKIIVTTRNKKVALMMQNEPFHHMQPIPEDQSWHLFKSHAFDKGDHTSLQEFKTIGKEIVKKCKGLPLAIKTVAGALRPKRHINAWRDFLSSEIWATTEGDILPALSLSYKHLPSHLKCCFAFCALFHKDVPFDKDEVVLLWMANDLFKPSTLKVGRDYFDELISRSFFESANGKKYLMHDLINDLTRSVSGNTCIRLEDYQGVDRHQSLQREHELPQELLHFSYLSADGETSGRFSGLAQARRLRTFLPFHQYQWYSNRNLTTNFFSDILPRFQRLRALNMSGYRISMVLDSIGDLKHLRFLNLASTYIKRLPNGISKCLNLQTLILEECKELVELPEDMRFLINLQLLDVRGVGDPFINKMATWLNIFKDMQNISIVVNKIYGSEVELLVQLQVRHSLNIIGLGDIVTTEKAKRAKLTDKDCIENLSLEWSGSAESSKDELNKFAELQPHTNTKQLSIKGYKGTRFPNWVGDSAFSNMESLTLEYCENCSSLPPLGQLTALKKLEIFYMDGITEIGKQLYGDASTSKPFQALEKLEFRDMAGWAIWNTPSDLVFSSLKSLKISHCNNILSFPDGGLAAPNLKKLRVEDCKNMKSLPARMHTQLPLLTELRIEDCPEIECFPEGGLPSSLKTLIIADCEKMRNCQTNWGLQRLPSLTYIYFQGFEDTLFPEVGLLPSSLDTLIIEHFNKLESLNEKGLQHLSSLRSLSILQCFNLKYLPQQKFSSSLSRLTIQSCQLVESFPKYLASSLSYLDIRRCPKLEERIEREKII